MGKVVGIDLGTTNSVVALFEGKAARVLTLSSGRQEMRSMVGLRKQGRGGDAKPRTLVGEPAYNQSEYAPKDTIASIKRLMGRDYGDPEVERVTGAFCYEVVPPPDGNPYGLRVLMGGVPYSPVDVSATILREIVKQASKQLSEDVTHAVITVPAYFSQAQNEATRLAGLRAGFQVIRLLDEPTAAAIAYVQEHPELDEPRAAPRTIMVLDLGGGTFDVSVLVYCEGAYTTMGVYGDMWLGGDDFDRRMLDWALPRIKDETGVDPREIELQVDRDGFRVALLKALEAGKRELSSAEAVDIVVPNMLRDEFGTPVDAFLELTRDEFDGLIEAEVDRADRIVENALRQLSLSENDIDLVLLAGNATLTPLFHERVVARFGRAKVQRPQHPKHAVAQGAAILARKLVGHAICPRPGCSHVNDEGAERCAACGASLVVSGVRCWACSTLNEERAERCLQCGERLEHAESTGGRPEMVSSVSDRDYGLELIDGSVVTLIEKGDPVPTLTPRKEMLATTVVGQEMLLVRVWGAESLKGVCVDDCHASDLEEQGQAVVMLPEGLDAGTGVWLALAQDRNRVFVAKASLENGTPLQVSVMRNDGFPTLERLHAADDMMRLHVQDLTAAERAEARRLRHQVEEGLADKQDALEQVAAYAEWVADQTVDLQALKERAEGLVGFADDLLDAYAWGLSPNVRQRLQRAREDVRRAVAGIGMTGSRQRQALRQAFDALDKATEPDALSTPSCTLTKPMMWMLGVRSAIFALWNQDEARAKEFYWPYESIRRVYAASAPQPNPSADAALMDLWRRLQVELVGVPLGPRQTEGDEAQAFIGVCPACGENVMAGELRCPNGHIQILPDRKRRSSSLMN